MDHLYHATPLTIIAGRELRCVRFITIIGRPGHNDVINPR
jgi:hypothetical protein